MLVSVCDTRLHLTEDCLLTGAAICWALRRRYVKLHPASSATRRSKVAPSNGVEVVVVGIGEGRGQHCAAVAADA